MKVNQITIYRGLEKEVEYPANAWLKALRQFTLNAFGVNDLSVKKGSQRLHRLKLACEGGAIEVFRFEDSQDHLVFAFSGPKIEGMLPEFTKSQTIWCVSCDTNRVRQSLLDFTLCEDIKLLVITMAIGYGERLFLWKTDNDEIGICTSGEVSNEHVMDQLT